MNSKRPDVAYIEEQAKEAKKLANVMGREAIKACRARIFDEDRLTLPDGVRVEPMLSGVLISAKPDVVQ